MNTLKTLAALAALTLAIGCTTTGGGGGGAALDCESAQRNYRLYLATLDVREPSEDEIKAARAAGNFLAAYCGWQAPQTVAIVGNKKKGGETTIVTRQVAEDANGVPVLIPPLK